MSNKALFQQDPATKDIVNKIGALFGVSPSLVKEVWEFTVYTWFLQLLSDPEKMQSFTVPFLGTVGVKFQNEYVDGDSELKTECVAFLSLSPAFKELIGDLYNNKVADLDKYLEDHKIQRTIEITKSE
jgi:hypothetical protein